LGTNNLIKYLQVASEIALPEKKNDLRSFYIGAVGIRPDGVIFTSRNVSCEDKFPAAHAEFRLAKRLNKNSVVYVARVTKGGLIALAKPCPKCSIVLKNKGIKKVYYTIDKNHFGILEFT
jgi:tRNA(Arg) A34 adenosine deaminase TadA